MHYLRCSAAKTVSGQNTPNGTNTPSTTCTSKEAVVGCLSTDKLSIIQNTAYVNNIPSEPFDQKNSIRARIQKITNAVGCLDVRCGDSSISACDIVQEDTGGIFCHYQWRALQGRDVLTFCMQNDFSKLMLNKSKHPPTHPAS